ncbi:unnamed protein product [Eretmochelys imbricata]
MKIEETSQHLLHMRDYFFLNVFHMVSHLPQVPSKNDVIDSEESIWSSVYLDDIIVFGNTSEEHDNNLQSVLNCISKAGLMLNRSKCKFRQTELSFLGHTISQAGRKPDPDHILAISNAPPPTDSQTLHSFLGLTSWHAKFILSYASVIEPL